MRRNIWFIIYMLMGSIVSPNIMAETHQQSDLVVNSLTIGNGGLSVGFMSTPYSCTGAFNTAHAFIKQDNAKFDQLFILFGQKRSSQSPVKIYYVDLGDCTSQQTLLNIIDAQ